MRLITTLGLAAASIGIAHAADDKFPLKLPAPGGEIILLDEESRWHHDELRFSAVRRVDDTLYVSGVIIGRRQGEGNDVAAFKLQARRGLERLRLHLEASGSDFQHVVMINSFHVWQGPNFNGTRDQQFAAFEEVIGEFMKPPYPAWTAVGTTGLLSDGGIIEVQLIAKVR
jgi:enamine deaminase RidA (YjgF/YER057c/UK114 family)